MFNFELGEKVRDKITHYFGIITARAEYLDNNRSYLVEGKDSTGRPIEHWISEYRIEFDDGPRR